MEIGELLVNLGFKADTTKLRDFIHDIGDLNLSSIIAATGLGGILDGIKSIMEVADTAARSLNNFHSLTGLSAQELQAWDRVAQESGISAGVIAHTVDGLQNTIENMKMTGEGAGLFNMLHLDPTKMSDTFTSLKMILQAVEALPIAEQKWVLTKFGLPEELVQMIPNLNQVNTAFTNSDQSLQSMANFMHQINELSSDFKVLMIDIGAVLENSFVGVILKTLDGFIKFVDQAQILYPLLGAISGVLAVMAINMGKIALEALIAALPALITNPLGLAVLAGAVGGGVLGLMAANNDNSKNVQMTNQITINGDSAENNVKALNDWHGQILNNAGDQQPNYNY